VYTFRVTYLPYYNTSLVASTPDSTDRTVTISNLVPGTLYNISFAVSANATSLRSRCATRTSAWYTVATADSVPLAPVGTFSAIALTSHTVLLSWTLPAATSQGGLYLLYDVLIERVGNQSIANPALPASLTLVLDYTNEIDAASWDSGQQALSRVFSHSVTVGEAGVLYSVQMRGRTSVGPGPYAQAVLVRTLESGMRVTESTVC
jgi:hypothetical protein